MTTPDQQAGSASATGRVESPTTAPGTTGGGTAPRAETTESSTEAPGPAAESTERSTDASSSPVEDQRSTDTSSSPVEDQRSTDEPVRSTEQAQPSAQETESASNHTLFGEDELSVLRSRWDEVQSGFVDDPKECVQKADGLVSDVVDRITTGFSEARSRLEEQWARGEEGSTEDLRLALKRYREFFQRLLSL
ncbi:hypothetical protein [Rhodococcus sp. USK13]|uniref:hypothetical protein n=1 Tax=Rhodococcus sp. USK13 TaxID=2806442 RepID=UPI001BCE9F7C|nr:hypothetical protein [Rhodococcus sp. USK13]